MHYACKTRVQKIMYYYRVCKIQRSNISGENYYQKVVTSLIRINKNNTRHHNITLLSERNVRQNQTALMQIKLEFTVTVKSFI